MGGNVGIGTTSPDQKLSVSGNIHIVGNGSSGIYLDGYTASTNKNIWIDGGNVMNFQPTGGNSTDGLAFNFVKYDGSTSFMNITQMGNILIGKTSQVNTNYKLDVVGNARINKVVVNTTGADFVFDSSYQLIPLKEVATYIQQNKHLPNIEPAKQM